MERIHVSDVLKQMDKCNYPESRETFSILFMKCSRKRRTGGDWVKLEKAQKCGLPYSCKDNRMRGIVNLESGMKSACYFHLIYEFNGSKVYW